MLDSLISLESFFLLFAFIANLGLSFFIYFKGRTNEVHRSLSVMLFGTAFWTISLFLFLNIKDLHWILFIRRLTPVGSSILIGYFMYFTILFPKHVKPLPIIRRYLILAPGYIFALFSVFSPLMLANIRIENPQNPFLGQPEFGILYRFYAVYFIVFLFSAISILIYKYLHARDREKLQAWYVLFGTAVAGSAGIISSLLLPLFNVPQFFTIGPVFTLILTGFIAYAIVKHKLLQIEDFLTRGLYILFALSVFVGTIILILNDQTAFIPGFYLISTLCGLGLLVYFRNWKGEANISYALFVFFIALWNYTAFFVTHRETQSLMWADKLIFLPAIFLGTTFLYFTCVFPRKRGNFTLVHRFLILVSPLLLSAFIPFNLIIKNVVIKNGTVFPVFGNAYPLFVIYIVVYFTLGLRNLLRSYSSSFGIERLQIKYIFLGMFLSLSLTIISNLVLPWLGEVRLAPFGPFFTLFFVFFSAYTILKHRLMSIEIIIQRGAVYTLATVLILSLYALAVMISEIYLRSIIGYTSLVLTATAALLIAIIYQPLVRGFQSLTDRLFFRGRYDYQKTLREISHEIASVIKLEELTRLIVSSFIDTMRVSEISFLLLEKDKEHFRSIPLSLPRYKKIEIDVGSPIVSCLSATKDVLVKSEVEDEAARQETGGKGAEVRFHSLEEVRGEMERLGISIWVPIVSKDELIGIIALGDKLSGDIFTTEDIGLLSTLGSQTAVALDNARLYNEVVNMKDYNEDILQSMVNGVLTVDVRARGVTYNDMANKICGRRAAEVLGKSCEEVWGKRGTITKVIENTLRGRPYTNFESSIASPERGLVPVSLSSTLLRDHQGKKIGALLTIQDMTEVKELEGKVRRADKLSALATMASGMAHEIKNPLSSMKVLSQLLPLKFQDAEYRKKLEEILPREINRIDRIVESLLGFARATALQFEKTDVHEVLQENIKYFADQAKESEVKITTHFSALPEIEIDQGQISQVFSNLMLNAIQSMPNGGELRITTSTGKLVDNVLQNVKVSIADTGHGISEDKIKKLFDPFFTTKHGGTGLGLTITHSIVDGHKGYIDVESKPGKGTTFTITLPVEQGLL